MGRKAPQSASTETEDLIARHPSGVVTRNRKPSGTGSIPRGKKRLALKSSHDTMKSRPLQKKQVKKRTLATAQPAARQEKLIRRPDDVHSTCVQQSRTGEGNESARGMVHMISTPTNGSDRREHHVSQRNINDALPSNEDSQERIQDSAIPQPALTRDIVLEMLKASEKRVIKHVISQQRVLLQEVKDFAASMEDIPNVVRSLSENIAHLQMMVIPTANGSSSQGTASHPRNQTLDVALRNDVVSSNPTLLAELKIVCGTNLGSLAAARIIASFMDKVHRTSDCATVSARCMNIFLYSKPKGGKKSEFKEGIGLRHANFRFKIASTALELAKALPGYIFQVRDTTSSFHQNHVDGESAQVNTKPTWLTSTLVDKNAMLQARKNHDCLKSEIPTGPSTGEKKKALFIAKSFMKHIIGMLRYSREKTKIKMFEDGISCLVDWETLDCFPSVGKLENPKLAFLYPAEDVIPASAVPETVIGDVDDVQHANIELLQKIISERKEMLVVATYDVYVTKTIVADGRRKEELKQRKHLRRIINLLRIAKSFVCAFCHLSEDDALRSHPGILRCFYRFAVVIREMFAARIYGEGSHRSGSARAGTQNSRQDNHENTEINSTAIRSTDENADRDNRIAINDPMNTEEGNSERRKSPIGSSANAAARKKTPPITLDALIPAESERDRIITNTFKMRPDVYRKLHVEGNESRSANDTQRNSDNEDSDANANSDVYEGDEDDMSDIVEEEE